MSNREQYTGHRQSGNRLHWTIRTIDTHLLDINTTVRQIFVAK